MALTATDVRLRDLIFRKGAVSVYDHVPFKYPQFPLDGHGQLHIFTGVGPFDGWYRAGAAEVSSPITWRRLVADQTAFLEIPPAVVISIKKRAFSSSWRAHQFSHWSDPEQVSTRKIKPW